MTPEETQHQLDYEWATVNGLRETYGLAYKGVKALTYSQAIGLAKELAPEIFDTANSLLRQKEESNLAQEYRQKAKAKSIQMGREVTAVELLNADIHELDGLIAVAEQGKEDRNRLKSSLYRLLGVREEIEGKRYTENQIIMNDVLQADRKLNDKLLPISDQGVSYTTFKLPIKDRYFRVRMLHPDKPEHITGADVIYESYHTEYELVRVVAIQYKVWEKATLYRNERLENQLNRLQQSFCHAGLCQSRPDEPMLHHFRLPHCCAFLRPTDRLQNLKERMASSGYHLPICTVKRLWHDGMVIERNTIRDQSVSHKIFEELFNHNMLGSHWMHYQELENLYQQYQVLNAQERIIIHAQEYSKKQDTK